MFILLKHDEITEMLVLVCVGGVVYLHIRWEADKINLDSPWDSKENNLSAAWNLLSCSHSKATMYF